MTATTAPVRVPIERTEHPHVVKSAGTLGGEPRVDGTRLSVLQIFDMAEYGMSVAEIIADFPFLTPAQVHDALSYAHDHPDEMEYHRERHKLRNILKKHGLVYYESRLLTPAQLAARGPLPPNAQVYDWETLPPELDE
jgi:uncharacterized protein (DUF433 family)